MRFNVSCIDVNFDQVDSSKKKSKRGFKVGKKGKVKVKSSALAKAKAAQAMEVDS